jgi:ABC-type multidrug transport system ATPase subunit
VWRSQKKKERLEMSGAQVILTNFSIDIIVSDSQLKTLLHPINAIVQGGSLFAILGGSGSGKVCSSN